MAGVCSIEGIRGRWVIVVYVELMASGVCSIKGNREGWMVEVFVEMRERM
jgi:hypothetical protein